MKWTSRVDVLNVACIFECLATCSDVENRRKNDDRHNRSGLQPSNGNGDMKRSFGTCQLFISMPNTDRLNE